MSGRDVVLRKVRAICLSLPEAVESTAFGNPAFRAGRRAFAVLECFDGRPSICFKASPGLREALFEDPRFLVAPHGGRHGWTCLAADGNLNWNEVEALLVESYRAVALRRMLAQLPDQGGPPPPTPASSRSGRRKPSRPLVGAEI